MAEIELVTAVLAFLDTDAVWGRRIRAHARRRHCSGGSRRSRFVNRTSSTSSRSCSTAPPRDTLGWGARVSPHPSSTASRAHG